MAHDVFISYASQDKPTADAACAILEAAGVRCWIAPRDILPGREWSEAIIDGIEGARIMVLIFSAQTNASRQIVREVERAVNKGLTIITLRLEDVAPARNLEYFLATPHWLDALTPPLERHLEYLKETVQVLLGSSNVAPTPPPPAPALTLQRILTRREVLLGAGGVAALLAVGFGTGILGGGSGSAVDTRLVGSWNVQSAMTNTGDGSKTDWSVSLAPSGQYSGSLVISDAGGVEPLQSSDPWLLLTPDGGAAGYTRSVSWEQTGDTAKALTAALLPSTALYFLTSQVSSTTGALFLSSPEDYRRTSGGSGSSLSGTWERESDYGSMHWKLVFDVTDETRYTFEGTLLDSGKMTAKDGHWRQVSESNGLQEGDYEVVDQYTIVFRNTSLTAPTTSQVTWRRADKRG